MYFCPSGIASVYSLSVTSLLLLLDQYSSRSCSSSFFSP